MPALANRWQARNPGSVKDDRLILARFAGKLSLRQDTTDGFSTRRAKADGPYPVSREILARHLVVQDLDVSRRHHPDLGGLIANDSTNTA